MPVASTQSAYAPSSDSPIRGNPGFVYELPEYFPKEFTKDLCKSLQVTLIQARNYIRRIAQFDPYWAKYEDLISTKFADGAIQYTLTGDKERVLAALDLEYGTPEEPPHSLLRKVAIADQYRLTMLLTKTLNTAMPHA